LERGSGGAVSQRSKGFGAVAAFSEMIGRRARVPLGAARCGAMFFGSVNQVLVRLWTRVMVVGPQGPAGIPSFGSMSDRESGLARDTRPSGWAARVQRRDKIQLRGWLQG
jgi:hypothetical protein